MNVQTTLVPGVAWPGKPKPKQRQATMQDTKNKVLLYIFKHPGKTSKHLAEGTGLAYSYLQQVLTGLKDDVEKVHIGMNTVTYWRKQ